MCQLFLSRKYDVISQLRNSYAKDPFWVMQLKYTIMHHRTGTPCNGQTVTSLLVMGHNLNITCFEVSIIFCVMFWVVKCTMPSKRNGMTMNQFHGDVGWLLHLIFARFKNNQVLVLCLLKAFIFKEIGYLLLPSHNITEITLKLCKTLTETIYQTLKIQILRRILLIIDY